MAAAEDIAAITEIAEHNAVPDGGQDLLSALEMLPDMFDKIRAWMGAWADWMASQPSVPDQAADALRNAQPAVGTAGELAGEAFLHVNETASFWNGDGEAA